MLKILQGINKCNNELMCLHGYMGGIEGFIVIGDEV